MYYAATAAVVETLHSRRVKDDKTSDYRCSSMDRNNVHVVFIDGTVVSCSGKCEAI
jgi:hypothetical protein